MFPMVLYAAQRSDTTVVPGRMNCWTIVEEVAAFLSYQEPFLGVGVDATEHPLLRHWSSSDVVFSADEHTLVDLDLHADSANTDRVL